MKDTEITQCVEILETHIKHCEYRNKNLYAIGPDGKEVKLDNIKDNLLEKESRSQGRKGAEVKLWENFPLRIFF